MEIILIIGVITGLALIILWKLGEQLNKGCIITLLVIILLGFLISSVGQCVSSSNTKEDNWMDNLHRP
ncbi:hypothetical protein C799_00737 [Bacteroides thetaiotaomicron dnLKV9]|uniref:Uncharacterized protein n=1 Tax=Bacteroides thetaiotaomicron dnLKV9 TaxID=1235785 RepID=R9HNE2_BACT4|nr:hypothetical protein [Bacteroides thetaiotaomicron]EOS02685.1 hypothetical protein C799_00737 [Bacteroides thetaiotaomicron dnLKV9]